MGGGIEPLFLLAPMNRSGTNFLREVLLCHPDVRRSFCYEDYSLAYTNDLLRFVEETSKHWGTEFSGRRTELEAAMSESIRRFFGAGQDAECRYLLLTTPRPWGIRNALRLYPNAKLVVLGRDGRNTIASAQKSFPWGSFWYWLCEWKRGVGEVLEFARTHEDSRGTSWDAVSYESLCEHPEGVILHLLAFLGLDSDRYCWEKFKSIPLWGSSDHGIGKRIEKPKGFRNDNRSQSWNVGQRLLFAWWAGRAQAELRRMLDSGVTYDVLSASRPKCELESAAGMKA